MAGGDPHDHRRFAHGDRPETMPENHLLYAEAPPGLSFELGEGVQGERPVRFVIEGRDSALAQPVGPNSSREEDHSAQLVPFEPLHRCREGEAAPRQFHAHVYPPPYGGCTANSSPGRTRVARPATYRPLRTNRQVPSTGASFGYF